MGFAVPNIAITDGIMKIDGYSVFDGERKAAFLDAEHIAPLGFFLSPHAKGVIMPTRAGAPLRLRRK